MMRPLARAATLLPPAALRADAGVALTAFARYAPALLTVTPVMLCRGQLLLYTDRSRNFAAALLVCLLLPAKRKGYPILSYPALDKYCLLPCIVAGWEVCYGLQISTGLSQHGRAPGGSVWSCSASGMWWGPRGAQERSSCWALSQRYWTVLCATPLCATGWTSSASSCQVRRSCQYYLSRRDVAEMQAWRCRRESGSQL